MSKKLSDFSDRMIGPERFEAAEVAASMRPITLPKLVGMYERQLLIRVLDSVEWNRCDAALVAGVTFRQLRYLIDKHDIGKLGAGGVDEA